MEFKIKYNKWSNFLFFVEMLSGWNTRLSPSSICNYWETQFGKLSSKEKNALNLFKRACINYQHSKNFFREAFFNKENPWQYLKNNMSLERYNILYNAYQVLKNKFKQIYETDLSKIKSWRSVLPVEKNEKIIFKKLNFLYNTNLSFDDQSVDVYIMLSSPKRTDALAMQNSKSIILELSQQKQTPNSIKHVMCLIWHEVIHLYFERKYYYQLIQKKIANKKKQDKIKELTACSLFPRGVLAQDFFGLNHNLQNSIHYKVSKLASEKIVNLSKKYIREKQYFDESYIKRINLIISRF